MNTRRISYSASPWRLTFMAFCDGITVNFSFRRTVGFKGMRKFFIVSHQGLQGLMALYDGITVSFLLPKNSRICWNMDILLQGVSCEKQALSNHCSTSRNYKSPLLCSNENIFITSNSLLTVIYCTENSINRLPRTPNRGGTSPPSRLYAERGEHTVISNISSKST